MVDTFTGYPDWYGGQNGVLGRASARASQATGQPYSPYPARRTAGFEPLQEQAFGIARQETTNPEYANLFNESTGAIRNAIGQNISPQIAPYIQQSIANPTLAAQQYMNPYNQAVTENIGKYGSRNLLENILPNVQDQFVRGGQYGSTRHQDLTGRAIRDTQEGISRAQADALRGGYSEALNTAVGQQGAQRQAGQLTGAAIGQDLERQLQGGTALQGLSALRQGERRQDVGLLGTLGGLQQQQAQTGLNTQYADWLRQQDYPYVQAARENELIRGLPAGQYTSTSANYLPQAPSPSPWTQGAGLLAGVTGAAQQRGFAQGGLVHKPPSIAHLRHYADGGAVDLSPIQKGVNDALDTSEIQAMRGHAQRLSQQRINPLWASVARAGFNLAANPKIGVLGKLGEAGNAGLNEYHGQLGAQDEREMGASKIYELIDNTRRLQAERNRQHEFQKEKFKHEQSIDLSRLGLEKEKVGLLKSKHDYDIGELSGGESKEERAAYKKADTEAIHDYRKAINAGQRVESILNELKELNTKVKTGAGAEAIYNKLGVQGLEKSGYGKAEDLARYISLSKKLQLAQEQAMTGTKAFGRSTLIGETKPQIWNPSGANKQIIEDNINEVRNMTDRSKSILGKLKLSGPNKLHAPDVESAYDDFLTTQRNNPGNKTIGSFDDFLKSKEFEAENGMAREPATESAKTEQKEHIEVPQAFKEQFIQLTGSLDNPLNGKTYQQAYNEFLEKKKSKEHSGG